MIPPYTSLGGSSDFTPQDLSRMAGWLAIVVSRSKWSAPMPDTSKPPPKSGNGPFILAAIVMLLLMGGLIMWKMKGDEPKAKAPVPDAPAPTRVAVDEPPPPPPPPAVDSAVKEEPKPGVKRFSGTATPSCNGECAGEATAALRSALRAKAGQAQGCYERALRQNSTLQGRLSLGVRVGPAGQVCSASVLSNGLGDPGIAGCVLQMFRSGSFPPPEKGCVDTQVPLNFQPKT
jgi:hypothetical protein